MKVSTIDKQAPFALDGACAAWAGYLAAELCNAGGGLWCPATKAAAEGFLTLGVYVLGVGDHVDDVPDVLLADLVRDGCSGA